MNPAESVDFIQLVWLKSKIISELSLGDLVAEQWRYQASEDLPAGLRGVPEAGHPAEHKAQKGPRREGAAGVGQSNIKRTEDSGEEDE